LIISPLGCEATSLSPSGRIKTETYKWMVSRYTKPRLLASTDNKIEWPPGAITMFDTTFVSYLNNSQLNSEVVSVWTM